jgi:hypothetical protein
MTAFGITGIKGEWPKWGANLPIWWLSHAAYFRTSGPRNLVGKDAST